jgi:hypothetical protein
MPTAKELLTLVDFTRSKPAINGDVFPSTPSDVFWAVPGAYDYAVSFETGELTSLRDLGFVRCVQ